VIANIEFETDVDTMTESTVDDSSDDVGLSSARWRSRLGLLVPAFFVARVLATDTAGIVTNDSLGYFSRAASNPFGEGLVVQGYRQVAQPLWIVFTDLFGDVMGWDRVFGVAIVQRSVLLAGVLLVWWALRAWSIPVLLIVTTPAYVVHADFVLPEGFLIPWCLFAAGLTASVATRAEFTQRFPATVAIASGSLAFMVATIKLQYASLLCLTTAIAWILTREGVLRRRIAVGSIVVPFVLIASLAIAQSFENKAELGIFEPVSERARAEWYGAWQAIFVADKENRSDPALVEFFDEGNLYTFLKGLEGSEPDYKTRVKVVDERIDAMFEAADTSPLSESANSFLGGLQAGRTDDVAGIVNNALGATPADQTGRLTLNNVGRGGGVPAVLAAVNESRPSGVLSTSVVFRRFGRLYEDYRPSRAIFAMTGVLILLGSLMVRGSHRPTSLAALGLIGSVSAALGSAYIDNARYLLGPTTIVLVMATVAVRSIVTTVRGSPT
jgi:hypothetical protein